MITSLLLNILLPIRGIHFASMPMRSQWLFTDSKLLYYTGSEKTASTHTPVCTIYMSNQNLRTQPGFPRVRRRAGRNILLFFAAMVAKCCTKIEGIRRTHFLQCPADSLFCSSRTAFSVPLEQICCGNKPELQADNLQRKEDPNGNI